MRGRGGGCSATRRVFFFLCLSVVGAGREGQFFEGRDLATTPGGTIYGVTPGGSRIVYDRETLLALRNSPMAQTPPRNMARIPGVTAPADYVEEPAAAAVQAGGPDGKKKKHDSPGAGTTFAMEDD